MDQVAEGAVVAVPYTDDTQIMSWLDRLSKECHALVASTEETDWEQYKQRMLAWPDDGSVPPEIVHHFIQYLEAYSSAPLDTLRQLGAAPREALTAAYNGGLGWLHAGHAAQLDELWEIRGDWRQWLPAELDTRWADWRAATPGTLAGWLDNLLPSLVLSSGATIETEPGTPPDPAVWTEYLQRWNGNWDGQEDTWSDFAARVVYYAPDGFQSTAEQFVAYVESQPDKAACLLNDYGITVGTATQAATAAVDVSALDWVTPDQQGQLADEDQVRGASWRTWLPIELDTRIGPEWRTWTPEALTARLDMLIPMLVLPAEDHDVAKVFVDNLNAILEDETVQEYMSEFDEAELMEIMQEAKELAMAEAGAGNE